MKGHVAGGQQPGVLVTEEAGQEGRTAADLLSRARRWGGWPIALVLTCYALGALIVPTMTAAPVSDDWVYARSVEILLRQHRVRILDLSVVTQLFQLGWGAIFAALFGLSFGALRLSTVVLVGLSGWACYALCRETGSDQRRGALGAAAYLFNPLALVLTFTYMSDPTFTALLVISTFCFARAVRLGERGARWLVAGSACAALTFLARQQGIFIPAAVLTYFLLARRLRPDRAGITLIARVAAIPAATVVLYYLWLIGIHGVPFYQTAFAREVRQAGWRGAGSLLGRMVFVQAAYLGFFVLSLAVAALVALPRLLRSRTAGAVALAWGGVLGAGLIVLTRQGYVMPYVPQFVGAGLLGPEDLAGERPALAAPATLLAARWVATWACLAASLIFAAVLGRAVLARPSPARSAGAVVVAITLWQALGVLPPSFHFINWAGSLDRYLLPLLPLGICLFLWAARGLRLTLPPAWALVAILAVYAVGGTRDFLVFQGATWDLARHANALGIPNTRLDAGASWDGYHLYEYGRALNISLQTPNPPWWIDLFAPATDSSYRVANTPLPDYDTVETVAYSSWLAAWAGRDPPRLYLLRRRDVPGPP